MKSLPRGLYLVTPDWDDTQRLLDATEAAIRGGAVMLQYRNKTADAHLRIRQAEALAALARAYGTCFVVNDDARLALDVGADGVHIGRDDGDTIALRSAHGADFIIGVSCYDSFDRAQCAVQDGASYIAFGAMFASPTKPEAVAAPLELVTRAKAELPLPVACIGGITADNAGLLAAGGADLVAVITDIYAARDPQAQAARFAAIFS